MIRKQMHFISIIGLTMALVVQACKAPEEQKEAALYTKYCASCHIAPDIEALPKHIWENAVLPDMLSRMDIVELYQGPDQPPAAFRPKIRLSEWIQLKNYIVSLAPDSLHSYPLPETFDLKNFKSHPIKIDDKKGAFYTFLKYNSSEQQLWLGDMQGSLTRHDFISHTTQKIYQGQTPITWYSKLKDTEYITEVGILDPSEQVRGKIITRVEKDTTVFQSALHRPVHHLAADLNNDGLEEVIVSEFGNETGRLSLLFRNDSLGVSKKVLLNQPGCIKTVARDMNRDGKMDLITLTSQSNEGITILYQQEELQFVAKNALVFGPVWGSSWFELVDYNKDGYEDIITVHGDNADKSYVHKPYHGMRIHINDGTNTFTEAYFYPLHGATRCITRDFDQDGDLDMALLSTFPDYERAPQFDFVYLENKDAATFDFQTKVLAEPNKARWFLMDAGDVDNDGDEDIILSSFTYTFTPVPDQLSQQWDKADIDLLFLENTVH
ncbi:MAG: VCBS repeat-containing protein [Bacteroidota bacterium]